MSLEVRATFEAGVLEPDKPLPLAEHARFTISVTNTSDICASAAIVPWNGDATALEEILGLDNRP